MIGGEKLFQLWYQTLCWRWIISTFQILAFSDTKLKKCLDRFFDLQSNRIDANVYKLFSAIFPERSLITVIN